MAHRRFFCDLPKQTGSTTGRIWDACRIPKYQQIQGG